MRPPDRGDCGNSPNGNAGGQRLCPVQRRPPRPRDPPRTGERSLSCPPRPPGLSPHPQPLRGSPNPHGRAAPSDRGLEPPPENTLTVTKGQLCGRETETPTPLLLPVRLQANQCTSLILGSLAGETWHTNTTRLTRAL